MARRKKGNPINGWIILDKPVGMTSTQAVGKVRWLFQAPGVLPAGLTSILGIVLRSRDTAPVVAPVQHPRHIERAGTPDQS